MTRFINNPPSAKNLMVSARSFGSYDLPGAIADLIDNSIKANAKIVRVLAQFNEGHPVIRIIDDGDGMSEDELLIAMRPASQNPEEIRFPNETPWSRFIAWLLGLIIFTGMMQFCDNTKLAGNNNPNLDPI